MHRDGPDPAPGADRRGAEDGDRPLLLDTNALLLPFRERFPLFPEIERVAGGRRVVIPTPVLRELEALAGSGAPYANAALELARRFPVVPAGGTGDDAIAECADRLRAWVVTADRGLARRLRQAGITVLGPRGRHRLELRAGAPVPAGPPARAPPGKPA